MDQGRVFLVGAGPGDPGLITERGLHVLRTCDAVIYDRLVPPRLLQQVPDATERIFVGRAPGGRAWDHFEIDNMIIERARAGRTVVRLEGGDPLVFGRGGEEAAALRAAGVDFEIIPGISAATGSPAYAGIPLTQRGRSSSFAVVGEEVLEAPFRWGELARGADTLVLLMDVPALRRAAAALISEGHDPGRPIAVIQWGTTPAQRVVEATLKEVAEGTESGAIAPPATAIIGEVVKLRRTITWFEKRPLLGLKVVVTRAQEQAGGLTAALEALGASVVEAPVIRIKDPVSWHELDRSIRLLAEGYFRWLVLSSTNAVEKFWGRLDALGLDARALRRTKVAAVGNTTATGLRQHGIRPDLVPSEFTSKALVSALGRGAGRILIPRVQGAPRDMTVALGAAGWTAQEVVAYRNVPGDSHSIGALAVRAGGFDVLTFTSPSTVRNYVSMFGKPRREGDERGRKRPLIACIGPATASAAEAAQVEVDLVPEEHSVDGLVGVLLEHFGSAAGAPSGMAR